MPKKNIVAHVYRPPRNDKVYMCCIRKVGATWVLLAKWGRRGCRMSNQPKGTFSTEGNATVAQASLWREQQKKGYLDIESPEYVAYMKLHGGSPLRLDSPGIRENLEADNGIVGVVPGIDPEADNALAGVKPPVRWECQNCGKKFEPVPNVDGGFSGVSAICISCIAKEKEAARRRAAKGEDDVMVCADNSGMEDRFDVGIEYLVEEHKDKTMVHVYDKLGRKDEYFRIRFVTPEQWKRKNNVSGGQEFKKFKPGDTVTIRPVDGSPTLNFDPELTEEQVAKLLEHRGGCKCSTTRPPCSACTDPITKEEYDDLGFGYSAAMPTRKTAGDREDNPR